MSNNQRAKLIGRGSSVNQQRSNFRNEFIKRLKTMRTEKIDKLRHICETTNDFNSVSDLRNIFLPDEETTKLLNSDDLIEILNKVEQEIKQIDIEEPFLEETNAIMENLMSPCVGCDNLMEEGVICETCSKQLLLTSL